ncbi:MAG TPA: zf-HC2 domain-containing protein [Gemmatimonadales bacterium]|nr:zf-HC2 domain-containing protein [Gemmatimonadales bacterium]
MSHLDEGTLHALLDGELDLAEVSEVQRHLGTCVACGSRLQEVKQVLAEADRLVGTMEVPAKARGVAEPPPAPPPPPFRSDREPAWDEPPVLLVPDPVDPNAWRRRWLRGLKWAAAIAVVVVGGRMVGDALGPRHPVLPERDLTSASPAVPPAVVSAEESRRPEPAKVATGASRAARPETRSPTPRVSRPAPAAEGFAIRSQDRRADTQPAAAEDTAPDEPEALAMDQATADTVASAASADSTAAQRAADSAAERARELELERMRAEEQDLATRRAAAAALEELDRERRRQRANAATAALPPPTRPEVEAEPVPAPRPPTLEQRAQIYLRIGLDEAVKHLGGPVHVIEGMTPEFIGLTRTQLIPGTSSNRPVVRVVYVDSRGRLILLDQQRMESGQAPTSPSGSLRWAIGDVMLYLRGEPSPEVLRSLQARVR